MKNTNITKVNTNTNHKGEITLKKKTMKTRIIAAILAVITSVSATALAATSASAAETTAPAETTASATEVTAPAETSASATETDKEAQKAAQKKKDFEELSKAKDGKEALEIYQKIYDRMDAEAKAPKPDPIDHKGMTTVKTQDGEKDYATFEEALAQAIEAKNASIKLHAEQNRLTGQTIPAGCDINIDLNGFSMHAQGTTFTVNEGGVLHVSNGFFSGTESAVKANGAVYLDKLIIRNATTSAVNVAQGVTGVITNCTFEENNGERGGAIYMPGFGNCSLIENSTFIDNRATKEGGAVYTSTPIKHCTFKYNKSDSNGGAVYYGRSNESIHHCTFEGNSAAGNGGALYLSESNELPDNIFKDNHSDRSGGAIYTPDYTDQKILFSKFYRNTANGSGGGIYIGDHSRLEAIVLTLTGNESNYRGGAIYLGALSETDHYFDATTITNNKAPTAGGVYCDAGFGKAADVYLNRDIIVKDNENGNFYLVKDYGKKAVLYTTKSFFNDQSCVYVNSSESGERAVVSLEEKYHENAFHGDNGRALERGTLHNYTLYIQ